MSLLRTYQAQTELVRSRSASAIMRSLTGLTSADEALFLSRVNQIMGGSTRAVSQLTQQYLRLEVSQQLASAYAGPALNVQDLVSGVRGVPWDEQYQRPLSELRWKASNGVPFESALAETQSRLANMVSTDQQYAKTLTANRWMADADGVIGYRRVVGGMKPCGLCLTAAQNTYHKGDLMPIHNHCHCTPQPITDSSEITVGDSGRNSVQVQYHDELGPQLVGDRTVVPDVLSTTDDLYAAAEHRFADYAKRVDNRYDSFTTIDIPADDLAQYRAWRDYTIDAEDMNDMLRSNPYSSLTGELKGDVDNLTAYINGASRTTDDLTVWRGGVWPDELVMDDFYPGARYLDNAFISTSVSRDTAKAFGTAWGDDQGLLFKLLVPKGSKGVAGEVAEQELLLQRGSQFRVLSVTKPTKSTPQWIIEAIVEQP